VLDELYSAFDECVDQFGLEKIKSSGPIYLVVGGAPVIESDHSARMAAFALQLGKITDEFKQKYPMISFQQKIGLHLGPIIAGVIGKVKTVYDIWGGLR
jgi:class 3 adenylate cyclase